MPGKVKVRVVAGRNLPVMDRSSDTTDAYVEVKLGSTTYKTDVCRKSLNPQWNSEWYKFELDDIELQDEPLQIRIMDHDTYSANDAIGKVYFNLNPLLLPQPTVVQLSGQQILADTLISNQSQTTGGSVVSGWFPVFDTMHGIRGEVHIIIKVELFSDFNRFRQSSCGIQFFYSGAGITAHTEWVHGFVEELVVEDDPEYQWLDKIRTPRATNEARQTIFLKLSNEVQRRIGLKVLELGANAVIGYNQYFDLEGESGIVVRGIGTAVTLVRHLTLPSVNLNLQPTIDDFSNSQSTILHNTPPLPMVSNSDVECIINNEPSLIKLEENVCPVFSDNITASECSSHAFNCDDRNVETAESPSKVTHLPMHRRSSDSEINNAPKGNSLTGSGSSTVSSHRSHGHTMFHRSILSKDTLDAMEYPFLTMTKYPPGFVVHLGGMVNAKSVKLLERMSNMEEPESRDSWWSELRLEMRSHARALSCNVILGYSEHTSICDDVCVLSAMGTAAVVNLMPSVNPGGYFSGIYPSAPLADIPEPSISSTYSCNSRTHKHSSSNSHEKLDSLPCSICHIPYNEHSVPFSMNMKYCSTCKRYKVPHILLSSLEPMERLTIRGTGTLLQTFVCRNKRELKGEMNAKEISDGLPFLEYELHSQLLNKLRVKGMNAIFGLKIQVCLGERVVSLHATGTAMYITCLPEPPLPLVKAGKSWAHPDQQQVLRAQKLLNDAVVNNRQHYHLIQKEDESENMSSNSTGKTTLPDINLSYGNRDTCILEMDDAEDLDVVSQLLEPTPPGSFLLSNTDVLPGTGSEVFPMEPVCNLQMFTQVWRSKAHYTNGNFDKQLQRMLQGLFFKLRRMTPCGLGKLSFKIDIPEPDELQISIVGMALGLGESDKTTAKQILRRRQLPLKDFEQKTEELIFKLEEDVSLGHGEKKVRKFERAPRPNRLSTHAAPKDRYGVDITPMTYIPGAKIERYLGNLNFFFIRESTCIRESGGLSGFVHCFVAEVMAIVRAHVTALGGNAMVAYFMNECILLNNPHKNQGQCLLNVGGDVVEVSYFNED
ncbi:C2 domain-containing protein 5 isoform X3 [Metopolophium dirhodum]|uniref:C2 domain-containing protein 5 isoform X3 n=1 Tax=Metopolophium dirhodum TaxID=44670 RepID=UPI0029907406|nr:C2 domain-containing protein 5 isoform X3 [Metopolophium dirhodum]